MQSKIFEKLPPDSIAKPQLRQVGNRNTEIREVLSHDDGTRNQNITSKPTVERVNNTHLMQKKELTDYARVYNARRNQSAITFS